VSEIPREEAELALETRRELGPRLEPEVVDGFVERVEATIDRKIDEKLAKRKVPAQRGGGEGAFVITLVSLVISVPLIGIAASQAGLAAIIAVCAALVGINVVVRR
jgi:hypothetical protein